MRIDLRQLDELCAGRILTAQRRCIANDCSPGDTYRYVGNSPTNAIDPTGLTQAGNPLNNLFGGYSGNKVSAAKPINPFVASGCGLGLDCVDQDDFPRRQFACEE